MISEKIITFAIPSYNVSETLSSTIDSIVLENEEVLEQLEVLVVNDGSKDKTSEIGHIYEGKYPGVVRVIDKKNGGYGSVINTGVEEARGKYFKIVDGDDWIYPHCLTDIISILHKNDVDLLLTDYIRHYEKDGQDEEVRCNDKLKYNKKYSFDDIADVYNFPMHSSFVKLKRLRENYEVIDEHCFYTDVEYEAFVVKSAVSILYVPNFVYVYRIGREGQSVSPEGWWKHRDDHVIVANRLVTFYETISKNNNISEKKKQYFLRRAKSSCIGHYKIGLVFPKNQQAIFVKELKKYDADLKISSPFFYKLIGPNNIVKIMRITRFSTLIYYLLSIAAKK